jgi:hypothetical protein
MIKELMENNVELKQFSYITTHNLSNHQCPRFDLATSPEKIEDPSTFKTDRSSQNINLIIE